MTIYQIAYLFLSLIIGYNISLDSIREEWEDENHDKKTGFHLCLIYLAKFIVDFIFWPLFISRLIWNKLTK
jgi:hypothetical protein